MGRMIALPAPLQAGTKLLAILSKGRSHAGDSKI